MINQLKLNTPLSIEDVDFRVQSINKAGYAIILAYKNARVDMNRLDAVYGVGFWQKKYEVINNNLFCSVGIWNRELMQWVWVSDVGTESFSDKEKGQASDAFKRACFNLGIGRELYDYPFIQIKLNQNEFKVENDRVKQTYDLKIKEWKWYSEFDEHGILTRLACKDDKSKLRFDWKSENYKKQTA
ncbi:hypothetical protein FCL53_10550 [Elizabethkingia meningoseptica]|uniref:Rad52/Rad22 family DNA repair protein n=1 Tax=Elizabethkingia meningoseptica TaxID=238 RepID=UPI001366595C|nr:Rad52/Rad22 family DNA repair protein [Elizabethkingia meningoseptica]MVW92404.1 hypothetical protein [Elizabethkingia meningoseptica]